VVFDDENLVSSAGLIPVMELAERAGLSQLLDEYVRFTSERIKSGAANATPKLASIVAGMAAGADSIDDLDVIRAGGMSKLFRGVYAAATLGILLREFTHGHTRQLQAGSFTPPTSASPVTHPSASSVPGNTLVSYCRPGPALGPARACHIVGDLNHSSHCLVGHKSPRP
jgi:hypothetical protein